MKGRKRFVLARITCNGLRSYVYRAPGIVRMEGRKNIGRSTVALPAMERPERFMEALPGPHQKRADLTVLVAANGGIFPTSRVIETIDGRREVAAHGPRDMPVWGRSMRFAPAILRVRIRAIVDYVATFQGLGELVRLDFASQAGARENADAARLRRLQQVPCRPPRLLRR
jgi:hypothetical protein